MRNVFSFCDESLPLCATIRHRVSVQSVFIRRRGGVEASTPPPTTLSLQTNMAANATLMPNQYNTSLDNYMPQLPAITASGTGFDALGIYFLTVCLAVIFVGALFGNFIVIGTLKRSWHNTVSKTGNYLVFLLALSDFLNALLNMPFICVSIIAQDWIFPPVFCKISGFFLTFLTTTSNNLLCMISLNRYYMVLAPNVHERISKRRSHRMGLYSWVHGFVIALSIVVGWGKYGFEQGVDIACIPHWDTSAKSLSNMFFVWLCAFVIPISIMVITYFRLFRLVRMRSRRVCPKHPYKTSTLTCPELANAGPSRQSTPQIPAVFAVNRDSGSLYLQNRKESMFPGNGGAQ